MGNYYFVKVPRENEYTAESAVSLFSGLLNLEKPGILSRLLGKKVASISFEIGSFSQQIFFGVFVPESLFSYFESQLLASYPSAVLEKMRDPLLYGHPEFISGSKSDNKGIPKLVRDDNFYFGQMVSGNSYLYPLKTYRDFKNVDPLAGILGVLSKLKANDYALVQLILSGAGSWQSYAQNLIKKGIVDEKGYVRKRTDERQISEKISQAGFRCTINLLASSQAVLSSLAGAFGTYSRPDGNSLKLKKPNLLTKNRVLNSIKNRTPSKDQILNVAELASL